MDIAPSQPEAPQRFCFLDGVRGLAAFAVVLYHLYIATPLEPALAKVVPRFLHNLVEHCALGVEAFFLLSGFVIALSVGSSRVDWKYAGNFALRRQLRLDPPYWTTIALQVLLIHASLLIGRGQLATPPTAPGILAHLFYLQHFFGFPDIVPIFWTLCFEVQFYAIFILVMALAQYTGMSRWRLAQLGIVPFAGSLWLFNRLPESPWCFHMWFIFQLGVLLYWTSKDPTLKLILYSTMGLVVLAAMRAELVDSDRQQVRLPFVLGLAIVFHIAALKGGLSTWLNWRWVQYLGRISYSLYLIHIVVGTRFITLFARGPVSPSKAFVLLAVGIAASIVAADLLNRFVEGPSMRLAARFKRKREAPAEKPPLPA